MNSNKQNFGAPNVLIMRPRPSAQYVGEKLHQLGYQVLILPFSQIEFLHPTLPVQLPSALLATSANAFRAMSYLKHDQTIRKNGNNWRDDFCNLPLFCVGKKTALAAQHQGFVNCRFSAQNVEDLCQFLAKHFLARRNFQDDLEGALRGNIRSDLESNLSGDFKACQQTWLYLAGTPRRTVLETFLSQNAIPFHLVELYKSQAITPNAADFKKLPAKIDYILLYSTQTIMHLAKIADHITGNTRFLCLSERIKNALPKKWQQQARIAQHATQAALLSLIE